MLMLMLARFYLPLFAGLIEANNRRASTIRRGVTTLSSSALRRAVVTPTPLIFPLSGCGRVTGRT